MLTSQILLQNGIFWSMSILTILLVAVFYAAWKAPLWVKEIGALAMTTGFFFLLLGFWILLGDIQNTENPTHLTFFYKRLKILIIPTLYGMTIYIISLVIRICQKPRL